MYGLFKRYLSNSNRSGKFLKRMEMYGNNSCYTLFRINRTNELN